MINSGENKELEEKVRVMYSELTLRLIEKNLTITTMESATSGLIASLITDTKGASAIFKGAFITYCNEVKIMQGVPESIIDKYGVYSHETVKSMATSCRNKLKANIGIGISGTMGNIDNNNKDSTIGEVYFAIDYNGEVKSYKRNIEPMPDRISYKMAVAKEIVCVLNKLIDKK